MQKKKGSTVMTRKIFVAKTLGEAILVLKTNTVIHRESGEMTVASTILLRILLWYVLSSNY